MFTVIICANSYSDGVLSESSGKSTGTGAAFSYCNETVLCLCSHVFFLALIAGLVGFTSDCRGIEDVAAGNYFFLYLRLLTTL